MRGFNHAGHQGRGRVLRRQHAKRLLRNYGLAIDGRIRWSMTGRVTPRPSGFQVSQETIFLPLSDDGNRVNMVITFTVVDDG